MIQYNSTVVIWDLIILGGINMWFIFIVMVLFLLATAFVSYMEANINKELIGISDEFYKLDSSQRTAEKVSEICNRFGYKIVDQVEHNITCFDFRLHLQTGKPNYAIYEVENLNQKIVAIPLNVIDGNINPNKGIFLTDSTGMVFALCY